MWWREVALTWWTSHALGAVSALGQKQTFALASDMSALPPRADIFRGGLDVRLVPKADMQPKAQRNNDPHGTMQKRA